jgi:hypothetical protein
MKNLAYIIVLFFLFSCSNGEKPLNVPKITLKLLDTQKKYIEDIAQDIITVDLGAPQDTMLKYPTHYFVTDSLILVVDRFRNAINTFDRKGNFKSRAKFQGDNKNQVVMITDVLLDEKQNQLEILDKGAAKILVCDINSRYLKTLDIVNNRNLGITFAKAGNLYVSPIFKNSRSRELKPRLSIFERTGDMLSFHGAEIESLPLIKNLDIVFQHQLENYKDSIYYLPLLDNKIYNVKLDEAVPAYEIVAPEITDALKKEQAKDHFEYWKKMEAYKVIYNVNSLYINDDWVTFRYNYQSKKLPREVIYSKKTGESIQVTELGSRKDPGFRSDGHIVAKYKDYFVMQTPYLTKLDKPIKVTDKSKKTKLQQVKISYRLMFIKFKSF